RYFPAYLPTVTDLLKREGVTGFAHLDREGHAACMVWVSDRDYYDNHLYRCWVRVPHECIYQFAGEVAQPYRARGCRCWCWTGYGHTTGIGVSPGLGHWSAVPT